VVVLMLLMPLTDWLSVWNDGWHWSGMWEAVERELRRVGEMSQTMVELTLRECHPLLSLLCVALVPAICEELFFRAGVQNLLQRWFKNVHVAVWVTAALFSLAHGEVFAFLPRFLLGALLGYLYVGGGSLVVNVLVHFVNNAIVVILFWLATPESGFDPMAPLGVGWTVTLACSLAAVMLMVVTFGKGLKTSK
jgi:membrane protease YdiL (CAAX protease family)